MPRHHSDGGRHLVKAKRKHPRVSRVPRRWNAPCTHTECSLHQLSPYIGKLKSSIARDLVEEFSHPGDLVLDPFCGAGTIALEAKLLGRKVFASDISPYSRLLSRAKLFAPPTLGGAMAQAERVFNRAERLPDGRIPEAPAWVRRFFHPRTLREVLRFAVACREGESEFSFACFLGILHHQRPGFLSYPSSHLVPYLRDKKYPRRDYPEMYGYRDIASRLFPKLLRAYARAPEEYPRNGAAFRLSSAQNLSFPNRFDSVITSPPYMNALDYRRDNRLRMWFIDPDYSRPIDADAKKQQAQFKAIVTALARGVQSGLKRSGHCVIVVGEQVSRSFEAHPADVVCAIMGREAPSLVLERVMVDTIPDVRRSRRHCDGTKRERFLVFRRK